VLLDEFVATVTRKKEAQVQLEAQERERRKIRGCLDLLSQKLVTADDEEDLEAKIALVYDKLDEDGSDGLNFEQFVDGMKRILKHVHVSRDDFAIVTENGRHLDKSGEFNAARFTQVSEAQACLAAASYALNPKPEAQACLAAASYTLNPKPEAQACLAAASYTRLC
jgi:hypothetical protein